MIGKVLGGRYEIIEKVGDGGMAIVYKAHCNLLDRFVAVKVLRDEFSADEEFIRKFRRESQAAASLSDPHIVNVYDVGEELIDDRKINYIVMEIIDGKTLKELIKEENLPMDKVLEFSIQIAQALRVAHQNHIVHRDIKPHNIMITQDGRVKVTDFGIARAVTSSTITTTSSVLGSVHYFSPEQARGGYTDEKSDIYSLGVVMYEMATGKLPYDGDSPITVALKHVQDEVVPPSEINHEIPADLEKIILKCMKKKQIERYKSAEELINDLKKVEIGKTVTFEDEDGFDDRTQLIPVISEDIIDKKEKEINTRDDDLKKHDNKSRRNDFLQIAAGILLALIIFFMFISVKGKMSNLFSTEEISVPKLVGLSINDAKKILEENNLSYKIKEVESTEVEEGIVISQEQAENTMVKLNFPIELTVSKGGPTLKMPDVTNKSLEDADKIIANAGLVLNPSTITYVYSDSVKKDYIVSQQPDTDKSVQSGDYVTVVVSLGKEGESLEVPHITNMKIDEAIKLLKDRNITNYKIIRNEYTEFDKDIVTYQSYASGDFITKDDTLEISVSLGKEVHKDEETDNKDKTDIADDNNDNVDNTDNEETETPTEKSITLSLSPRADAETTKIEIIKIYNGVSEKIFEKELTPEDGAVSVTLTGQLGTSFDILYDGRYEDTRTIQ
ncbi:MAG: Stk1 family PASTA domain-containing Ser/Thr kinase [Tissierellia bacterium]|nr:Stk1 family PASTA domain-containing Ser/Thr kinase [Tissierellia bacterium]